MDFDDQYYDEMSHGLPPFWRMALAIVLICFSAMAVIVPIAILIWLLY